MADWHFDQQEDGWTWRYCNSSGVVAASAQRFENVADAEADATRYGYLPGESPIGSIGMRWRGTASEPAPSSTLVIRRRTPERWQWEVRSSDGRVLNYSARDFATPYESEADAARQGLMRSSR